MTDQLDLIDAWNRRWNPARSRSISAPVVYCTNPEEEDEGYRERYVTTTYGMAFLDKDDYAAVRLHDYGPHLRGARLEHLTVLEDIAEKLTALGKVDGDEAIQHNPECPDCYVETNWDEGFDCPVCLTHFDDNGQFSHKVCVEYDCTEWGEVLGEDGQQRCVPCTVLVLAGELSPFGPYECRRCKKSVVGIPARSQAAKNRLCGGDQAAKDRQDFLDGILNRRH